MWIYKTKWNPEWCLCWPQVAILVSHVGTPAWHLHTKLYKTDETCQKITKKWYAGQTWDSDRLHKCIYESFFWLLPLNSFKFTVKTLYISVSVSCQWLNTQSRLNVYHLPSMQRKCLLATWKYLHRSVGGVTTGRVAFTGNHINNVK